ncbi:eukaryotic translation initiation factor 2D-like isoform X3 [Mustela nigripes]|uniref:eukaryotic translation initiation factor 2D-like isoform X3 n=1 Tax=Mustela nigripes TaxID=77151 RepID=UPI0028168885|nr:eukaryotic translation initiation factor 2D-like isoform X3 [Mustela nigripes]
MGHRKLGLQEKRDLLVAGETDGGRKLRADVAAAFPTLGTDQVSALVPGKEELNVVKLYAHRGDAVTVYVCAGNPILFELEKNLYPTDLMLPGLVVPPAGLPQVQKGDLCAIAWVGNRRGHENTQQDGGNL